MWHKIKDLLFHNRNTRQTVAKNTFWLGVSNVGGRLIRAIIIIYAARVLGAAEWGIFSYAVSLVALITVFTDIGISPMLIREAAKFHKTQSVQRQILSTSFLMKLVLLVVGILVVLFIAPSLVADEGVKIILPIVAFLLAFDTIREFGFSFMRAIERMEREAGLFLLTNAAIVVLGFIFLYVSSTLQSLTYAYTLGTGIGAAATMFALRKNLAGLFANFSFGWMKKILTSGWPFAISAILGSLLINTDILIIGWLLPSREVGLYSAAQRVVQLLYILPSILAVSLLPTLSRLANRDNKKMRAVLERVLGFVYLAAFPMAIGGFLLGREIIGLIFGGGYIGAASSFQILTINLLVDFPAAILSGVLFAYNRQKSLIKYAVIAGVSNVIFDILLIPVFGIVGSAFTTLIAQFFGIIYLMRTTKKVSPFKIIYRLKRIFIATAIMAILVLSLKALNINVLLVVGAGTLIYFGVLYLFREPLFKEIKLIVYPQDTTPQAAKVNTTSEQ